MKPVNQGCNICKGKWRYKCNFCGFKGRPKIVKKKEEPTKNENRLDWLQFTKTRFQRFNMDETEIDQKIAETERRIEERKERKNA